MLRLETFARSKKSPVGIELGERQVVNGLRQLTAMTAKVAVAAGSDVSCPVTRWSPGTAVAGTGKVALEKLPFRPVTAVVTSALVKSDVDGRFVPETGAADLHGSAHRAGGG